MLQLSKYIMVILFLASCSVKPSAINYGKEACDFCRMTIMDPKFGGEIVTKKGKVFKFDSEECLVAFYKANIKDTGNYSFILVADYSEPGKMMNARQAVFLQNNQIRSPMGINVAAFPNEAAAVKANISKQGKVINWINLVDLVK